MYEDGYKALELGSRVVTLFLLLFHGLIGGNTGAGAVGIANVLPLRLLSPEKSFRTCSNRFFCVILLVVVVLKLLDRHSPEQVEVAVVEHEDDDWDKIH